jgi:dephospho-CoA kinase
MVGLTGGIGAGKSAVAKRLARRGAVIIDADVLAREVVAAGTAGLAAVVDAFGPQVIGADGELDRPALGAQVFGDESARRRLEAIIHPRVRARTAELAGSAAPDAVVVNDVPLLVETGLAPSYHLVAVVHADSEVRIRRLMETRGMTAKQAAARIAAQTGDAQRRAAADVLLDNDAGLAALNERVDRLWRDRLLPYEHNLRHERAARAEGLLRLVDYDPSWPDQAARLIARIRHAAGPSTDVTHIGSTAVPGLIAKDLIDLMIAVPTLDDADALAGVLARAGLPRREGEWADNARGVPGETWPKRLHGSADPGRSVNLHIRVAGSPGWRFALLMRDHMRAVPEAREGYAAAKAAWAAQHPDVGGYGEAKEPWFDAEAKAAEEWAAATGWHPPARPVG